MSAIKVNTINMSGKPSSTTINENIAVMWYAYCVPTEAKRFILDMEYSMAQIDVAVAFRDKCLQDFVNKEIAEMKKGGKFKGVNQRHLEMKLIYQIKHSN